MKVNGKPMRTIWLNDDGWSVEIIDQTIFPFCFETVILRTVPDCARAITDMLVRGAPLIGATAAYGMALAVRADASDAGLDQAYDVLHATRPTAINLKWALDQMRAVLSPLPQSERMTAAYGEAARLCDEDVAVNSALGDHGLELIKAIAKTKADGEPVNILTHCNAGWLATVDWGTATAPIYKAHDLGLNVHVWVDETRPRNQGDALTAWELNQHGVPHHVIVDNAGGHLMQQGKVDLVIVGTDRTCANGDVCNKIGTYLKALAAHDNNVPFYVTLPSSTIDFTLTDGFQIPIEERDGAEVSHVLGRADDGSVHKVQLTPDGSPLANPAFDVTPARLVTGLITERGIVAPNTAALAALFPDRAVQAGE